MASQLTQLFISSIPTILAVLVVWAGYQKLVHGPLGRVLAERRRRTQGALSRAQEDSALADSLESQRRQRFFAAREAVRREQAAHSRRTTRRQAAALRLAKRHEHARVQALLQDLEAEKAATKEALEGQAGSLAESVLKRIV